LTKEIEAKSNGQNGAGAARNQRRKTKNIDTSYTVSKKFSNPCNPLWHRTHASNDRWSPVTKKKKKDLSPWDGSADQFIWSPKYIQQ
jgi:hypothetical protein